MSMVLRDAQGSDLSGLLRLYRHLSTADPELPEAQGWPRLDALLANDFSHLLVAEVSDALAATCLLLIVPNLTRGGRPFAIVENVVTDAAFRRQGLGAALLAEALARAWRADCYKVMLATGRTDEAVLRFYERAGFIRGSKTFFEARHSA